MPIHRTEKKNNVNRETLALKAIINQTRSIGNEFLVINIKVHNRRVRHRAVGCAQSRVVLGASRLQDKTNINKRKKVKKTRENPNYNPVNPGGMEMKIEQTTTLRGGWKKESHEAYIFAYLFIS